jgi:hypothetical protein
MAFIPVFYIKEHKNKLIYLIVDYRVLSWILLSGSCGESGVMSK